MKIARTACAAFALVLACSAWSQDAGFYLGANFGATRLDSGNAEQEMRNDLLAIGFSSATASVDESSTGYKFLGGYQMNRNFAVEGYYAHLGKYDVTVATTGPTVSGSGEMEVKGFGIDALAIFPFNNALSGFGRIGLFRWDADFDFRASGPGGTASTSDSDDGTDLKFGLGVEWKLASNLRLRGELEYYDFDDSVTMLSVGLLFRF